MKKLKKAIIIILILLIVLTITLLIINRKQNISEVENNSNNDNEEIGGENPTQYTEKGFSKVEDKSIFFTVTDCVQNYLNYINPENNIFGYNKDYSYTDEEIEKEREQILYNCLSEDYIEKNNVNTDNVKQKVNSIDEYTVFIPKQIIEKADTDIKKYILEGNILNSKINEKTYFIVYLDSKNSTFSIEPVYNQDSINNIDVSYNYSEIEDNIYNDYSYIESNDEDTIERYTKYIVQMVIDSPEELYNNYLNEEYKNKKFSTLDSFYEYINKNKENMEGTIIKKYKVNEKENSTEYICKDQYENYYRFEENDVMNYTVVLDSYTIESNYLIGIYKNDSEQEKVQFDITQIIEALNRKDYEYVYSKVQDSDKLARYPTYDTFENEIKDKFYDINKIQFGSFYKEDNELYKYNTYITNYYDEEENGFELEIKVNLKDNNDYEVSFTV